MSEFLRVEHRQSEIAQQQDGDDETDCADNVELHGLPQLLAGLDVKKRQDEESGGEQQHGYVLHRKSPGRELEPGRARSRPGAQPRLILARGRFEYRKDFLNKT
jgi:hypothetical protein